MLPGTQPSLSSQIGGKTTTTTKTKSCQAQPSNNISSLTTTTNFRTQFHHRRSAPLVSINQSRRIVKFNRSMFTTTITHLPLVMLLLMINTTVTVVKPVVAAVDAPFAFEYGRIIYKYAPGEVVKRRLHPDLMLAHTIKQILHQQPDWLLFSLTDLVHAFYPSSSGMSCEFGSRGFFQQVFNLLPVNHELATAPSNIYIYIPAQSNAYIDVDVVVTYGVAYDKASSKSLCLRRRRYVYV